MMVSGTWVTGRSNVEVAQRHGVSVATVKDWATCASRLIRLAIANDPEELRARYMAALEGIAASAMSRQAATMGGDLYANPDHKAAIAAYAESARLGGLVVQKHDVNMTEAQARETWKRLTGQEWPE